MKTRSLDTLPEKEKVAVEALLAETQRAESGATLLGVSQE